MTVRTLKRILADLSDDTPVLAPHRDHQYRRGDAYATTVVWDLDSATGYYEDPGEGYELTRGAKRVLALVLD